ncbi:MAG: hypothetical protein ACOYEV_06755 [Candidatus Nanopelagicales bacterium]
MLVTKGVDGAVELVAELDRRSQLSAVALNAPRSSGLYRYLLNGMSSGADEFTALTIGLIETLGIWWSPEVYANLPVMVPWCIRDRTCRYDQGPESWGSPRSDGYLRDDNSIIKKLPLSLSISGPAGSPFRGRKPWRGFTACHIWRDLPDGSFAGADPWLYSFVPNLIWLPTWLAPLTDRQGGEVQAILQRTSIALFRGVEIPEPLTAYAEEAWGKLPPPGAGVALATEGLQKFEPVPAFFSRRLAYLDNFISGCDEVLAGRPLVKKLICTRYTQGLPELHHGETQKFRQAMDEYRCACSSALVAGAAF